MWSIDGDHLHHNALACVQLKMRENTQHELIEQFYSFEIFFFACDQLIRKAIF